MKRRAPETCPACGSYVSPRTLSCPECDADENTGWDEEAAIYDGLDLPGQSPGSENSLSFKRINGLVWYWWLLGVVLLVLLGWAMMTNRW